MKTNHFTTTAIVAAAALAASVSTASAQGFSFDLELVNLTPARADGGSGDYVTANIAPRIGAAYEFGGGAGVRLEYWMYEDSFNPGQNGAPTEISFDQTTLYGYRAFEITDMLDVELSIGLRQVNFDDLNYSDAGQFTSFSGHGGVFGVGLSQRLPWDGAIYGDFEAAILVGDSIDNGAIGFDVSRTQMAVGLGYEHMFNFGNIQGSALLGYEFHDWGNFQDDSDGSLAFHGVVLGASIHF